jgi:hypothetical protein
MVTGSPGFAWATGIERMPAKTSRQTTMALDKTLFALACI